jgi:hypothetical protein
VNGSAVQFDESGTRKSIGSRGALAARQQTDAAGRVRDEVPVGEVPTKPRRFPCTSAVHDTYGVLPKNVMSGCEAS